MLLLFNLYLATSNMQLSFVDSLRSLTGKTIENNYFSLFNDYSIKPFGHKKRDELIQKCIANDENSEFDVDNISQVARLDKITNHINTIIRSNIIPSYPIIITSSYYIFESARTPQDIKKTSYGHCYHAVITTQLDRVNITPDSMNEYFNLLTELAYFMFQKETKEISEQYLEEFLRIYNENYISDEGIINNLVDAHILVIKGNVYFFQYIYIYYYFVAKYIAANFSSAKVKEQFDKLIEKIYKKDNSNIVIFTTHHAENNDLIDKLISSSLSTFKSYPEATLGKDEVRFLEDAIKKIGEINAPHEDHNVGQHRRRQLETRDRLQPVIDEQEEDIENSGGNLDSVTIEILKSAKNMEIVGQILKNQYGTLKKAKLEALFEEGQNVGLRMLKTFIDLANEKPSPIRDYIERRLLEIQEKGNNLSKQELKTISQKMANEFSYYVIYRLLRKIAVSLGYHKLITIADRVNGKVDTTASRLINFSIHAWYKKELDVDKLKSLYKEFGKEKNGIAQYILKDIVTSHLYMHKVDYDVKQKVNSLLGFSVSRQIVAQQELEKNDQSHWHR